MDGRWYRERNREGSNQRGRFTSRGRGRGAAYSTRGRGQQGYPSRGRGGSPIQRGIAGARRQQSRGNLRGDFRGRRAAAAHPRSISYEHLKDLERSKEPTSIVIHLASRSGLEECLGENIRNDMVEMLLKVFGKMAEADGPTESLTRILQLILEHKFLEKARNFLLDVKRTRQPSQVAVHVKNALKLVNSLITILPSGSSHEVQVTMYFLDSIIRDLGQCAAEVREYHIQVKANLDSLEEKQKNKATRRATRRDHLDDMHSQPAPDDFRDIPVFPQLSDINGDSVPFIRTNLINRAYEHIDHYLDVQFRLLREDFIRPLREGIAEVKRYGGHLRRRFENVKVYEGVTVQFMQPGRQNGILHRIQFDAGKLRGVRWNNTKRLIYGSLLCLSSDKFKKEVIFAVVMNRDPEDLSQGILTVKFVCETNNEELQVEDVDEHDQLGAVVMAHLHGEKMEKNAQSPLVDMKKVYTMVETEAYFEAYRHVLAGLKETEFIPLERYIVRYCENLYAPQYIRPQVTGREAFYDFSPVTMSDRRVEILHGDWPSPEELSLDPSQANALRLALTKELAIIQGPPGTGKTHVGLVIMKLLLHNKAHWSDPAPRGRNKRRCPILVVCYTNHALDQFLEGIAKFSKNEHTLVRVGGRCQNEATKPFSLREILQQRRRGGYMDSDPTIRRAVGDLQGDMKRMEEVWESNIKKLEASLHCIPSLHEIKDFVPQHLYEQFNVSERISMGGHRHYRRDIERQLQNSFLLSWLGIHVDPSCDQEESQEFEQASANSESQSFANKDYNSERKEEIVEDAALVENQRMLDIDEFPRAKGETKNRKEEMDQLIRQIGAITLKDLEDDDADERENQDDGPWEHQRHQKRKHRRRMKFMMRGTETMTRDEEWRVLDIHKLSQDDRWRLYRTWIDRWRQHCRSGIDKQIETYNRLARQLEEVRRQEDAEILQNADVVAVTTTGAAKYRSLIYKLNTKIVVVEEAAEVLEAHIITAMPKSTRHLILIGDHRQLKPSPTVYELARKYNLDTSLFERLIKRVQHVTLTRQHRMRPAIADLIRPHIYRNLQDHESVLHREDITGVEKPLYFLSHTVNEESIADGKSKKNQHEADFVVALCNHIIIQGYEPEQVTILTMYTGQLLAFRGKKRGRVPEGVRVTAVDNFQGEENDIILLSLVRSNDEAKIGFLAVQNRICVALSRAKNALYCIGNMELLASKSDTWGTIVRHLHETGNIGEALVLQCKHHPDRRTPVKCSKDFDKVPEGGCGHPCKTRLECGHVCPKPCHPYDHSMYKCIKPCDKIIPCDYNHHCKRKCWQPCQPCQEDVQKVMPKCGHIRKVRCQTPPEEVNCLEEVQRILPCSHQITIYCYQAESLKLSMCNEKCEALLDCRHPCTGSCFDCSQGRLHVPCRKKCSRILVCGHSCDAFCDSCPPCRTKCRTKCKHSTCEKACGEPCVLCSEKCDWKCPHFVCNKKCSEPCDRPPCNEPCPMELKCKHPCVGLCGEPCPSLCRICNKDELEETFFGDEDNESARFVQLEDCVHVFTYQSLDKWMSQEEEGNAIKMKECPKCKVTIWRSTRYGNIINKLLNSVNKVKIKIWGDAWPERNDVKLHFQNFFEKEMTDRCSWEMKQKFDRTQKKYTSKNDIILLKEELGRLRRFRQLNETREKLWKELRLRREDLQPYVNLDDGMKHLFWWVCLRRTQTALEEERCFCKEIKRMAETIQLIAAEVRFKRTPVTAKTFNREVVEDILDRLHSLLLENVLPFDETEEEEIRSLFQYLKKSAPELCWNLGISFEEKEMIRKAMGFVNKGHWYCCSNGHVYSIGECGGATEMSACPECKEEIGGSSHRLVASSRVATEMDGATRPAYDPENNYIPPELLDELPELELPGL